jgi:hypothetical protein
MQAKTGGQTGPRPLAALIFALPLAVAQDWNSLRMIR